MNNKKVFVISLVIIIIAVLFMGINYFVSPFSDIAVRVIGIIMLLDIVILSYTTVKLKKQQ